MRKFLSLIFALFVTLPFCTKCYAIEVDSLGDEVRHVVRQSVPANIEILDGSIQSGAAGDLEYLDQKVVFLKSGVSDAGKKLCPVRGFVYGSAKDENTICNIQTWNGKCRIAYLYDKFI